MRQRIISSKNSASIDGIGITCFIYRLKFGLFQTDIPGIEILDLQIEKYQVEKIKFKLTQFIL